MLTTLWRTSLRAGVLLAVAFFAAPISGATSATDRIAESREPGPASTATAYDSRDAAQRVALLGDRFGVRETSFDRLPATPEAELLASLYASARPGVGPMGLDLPEPGPLSAIIATLALAGFVFLRRVL